VTPDDFGVNNIVKEKLFLKDTEEEAIVDMMENFSLIKKLKAI
jgi:hypothetical protein